MFELGKGRNLAKKEPVGSFIGGNDKIIKGLFEITKAKFSISKELLSSAHPLTKN